MGRTKAFLLHFFFLLYSFPVVLKEPTILSSQSKAKLLFLHMLCCCSPQTQVRPLPRGHARVLFSLTSPSVCLDSQMMMKWMLFSLFLPRDVVDHHLQMPCKWSSWHWPMYHLCSHGYSIWEVPSGFYASQRESGAGVGLCSTAETRVQRKQKPEGFPLPPETGHQLLYCLYRILS